MAVGFRYSTAAEAPFLKRPESMRRAFIYPHRSVRAFPITMGRRALDAVIAVALTLAVFLWMGAILDAHNRLSLLLVGLAGIPVMDTPSVDLFTWFGSVPVPLVAVDHLASGGFKVWILFAASMLVLLELHRRIPLARGFLLFLMILVAVAAGVIVFHPSDQICSPEFAPIL